MRKQILSTLCLLLASTAFAQIPTDYYNAADRKAESALKTALHTIIKEHKVLTYGELWAAYERTDVVPGTEDQVFDMFSNNTSYYSSRGTAINREHVVPKSWWGGEDAGVNAYTDLFNVYPSDATANSKKSNYPLGEITGTETYDNGRTRIGKATETGGAPYVFEPCDEFKGDFARIYLYVATCYEDASWLSKYYAFEGGVNAYPTLKEWIIPTLLKWNRQDPVSEWEIARQEQVYGIQRNRNPFIDYPVLAEFIWGDSTTVDFNLATAIPHVINGYDIPKDDDDKPVVNPDDKPDTPEINPDDSPLTGNEIFVETFDSVKVGNDTGTSGSSTPWDGNEQIIPVSSVYSAGGAIRLGTGKKTGAITTVPIDCNGGKITVQLDVKGWTTIEGDILVSVSGCDTLTLSYTSTMSDKYETLTAEFDNASANPTITIETSKKRCFISAIRVYKEGTADNIQSIKSDPCTDNAYYTLSGQRLTQKPVKRGIYINKNLKVLVK